MLEVIRVKLNVLNLILKVEFGVSFELEFSTFIFEEKNFDFDNLNLSFHFARSPILLAFSFLVLFFGKKDSTFKKFESL